MEGCSISMYTGKNNNSRDTMFDIFKTMMLIVSAKAALFLTVWWDTIELIPKLKIEFLYSQIQNDQSSFKSWKLFWNFYWYESKNWFWDELFDWLAILWEAMSKYRPLIGKSFARFVSNKDPLGLPIDGFFSSWYCLQLNNF